MSLRSDFQMEMVSQTSIIHYIEFQFEKELSNVAELLDIKIKKNLYDNNIEFMKSLVMKCDVSLEHISKNYLPERPFPNTIKNINAQESFEEVIDYCIELLECEELLSTDILKKEFEEANRNNDEVYYNFTDKEIEEIIDIAQIIFDKNKNKKLYEEEISIESLKTSINLVNNASTSNIFRQSFINIFSIFDAFVFENLKMYFCKKPQDLEKFLEIKNTEKIKITIDDVLLYKNIEELKANMIHKQFDGKYLSEIIKRLKSYNPDLFSGIDYPTLMEMIERRNIHLHNKGYADYKYCTSYNIYRFNIGDYVYIDSKYLFTNVFNILSQFATNFEKFFEV